MNIHQQIDNILAHEGGYVDHPADKGGPTNMGITLPTLTNWLGREATRDDIKNLDKRTARKIYYNRYYINTGIDNLPMLIQPTVLDTAVNSGPKNAIKMLQDVITAYGHPCGKIDGRLGDKTIAAARAAVDELGNQIVRALVNRRVLFCERIVRNDETQRTFLAGWINRAESFLPENAA